MYWRDSRIKKEISFVDISASEPVPILMRYNKTISDNDRSIFKQAGFGEGLIISRDILEERAGLKIMPLSYFLLCY